MVAERSLGMGNYGEGRAEMVRSVESFDNIKVQLLVPIYNEGENAALLYQRLIEDAVPFDLLTFVYDLDAETALPFIAKISAKDRRVQSRKNTLGPGVVNALRYGFSLAGSGPVIVLMGDNSDKLSIVPEMIALWERGATVVSPSRYMKGGKQHGGGVLKSLLSRSAGVSLRLMGFPTADPTNNFKLYDGNWLRLQRIESRGGFEIALELCAKAFVEGKSVQELPTEWFDRTMGESRFRLFKWLPHYLRWYFFAINGIIRNLFIRK